MSTENTNLGPSKDQQLAAKVKADITAQVLAKVNTFQESGELTLPKDYNVGNALKSAYLVLLETEDKDKKPVLQSCTQESIANSLLKMVVWGLSPLKKQCYFVAYGNKLKCSPDYTGNIALAKRYADLKNIKSNAIHEGDIFEFEVDVETGRKKILKHKQTLDSIGSKNILGAYAIYEMNDGSFDTEIMNITQIKDAWNQGPMKGGSPAHKNFPDRMARKTVINRACDALIRSSDDKALYESEEEQDENSVEDSVNKNISQNANKKVLDFNNADIEEANVISEETPPVEESKPDTKNTDVEPLF